jgi:hypothetical protein
MEEIFHSLEGTELQQTAFHEDMTWDEYVQATAELANDDQALRDLLKMKQVEDRVNEITLQSIMSVNFTSAKQIIDKMTIMKRIQILEELDEYKLYLYDRAGTWGNPDIPPEEQVSTKEFRAILGRIKHLEILQGWLFGIS